MEPQPKPQIFLIQGLSVYPRLAFNLWPFDLSLQGASIQACPITSTSSGLLVSGDLSLLVKTHWVWKCWNTKNVSDPGQPRARELTSTGPRAAYHLRLTWFPFALSSRWTKAAKWVTCLSKWHTRKLARSSLDPKRPKQVSWMPGWRWILGMVQKQFLGFSGLLGRWVGVAPNATCAAFAERWCRSVASALVICKRDVAVTSRMPVFITQRSAPSSPLLAPSYEVAPRSDSEESDSDYEEEVRGHLSLFGVCWPES